MTADNPNQDQGTLYLYDSLNRRVVAVLKKDGTVVGDYMVASNQPWFTDLRGMFVTTDPDGANPVLYWVESGSLMSAALTTSSTPSPPGLATPTPGETGPSTAPSASGS
jgi:hypothetical protein